MRLWGRRGTASDCDRGECRSGPSAEIRAGRPEVSPSAGNFGHFVVLGTCRGDQVSGVPWGTRGLSVTTGVPMSRYRYDYSLTPGRPKGWRSLFRNVLVIGAIAAISAVSGGVVVLDLLGPGSTVADRDALVTPQTQPVRV